MPGIFKLGGLGVSLADTDWQVAFECPKVIWDPSPGGRLYESGAIYSLNAFVKKQNVCLLDFFFLFFKCAFLKFYNKVM